MRIGWVLGWAIPTEWFRPLVTAALPGAEHVLIEPSPMVWTELSARAPFDWVVGYSLGSLLLVQNPERAAALGRVALLAPIWAFPAERESGGRIARANLRALIQAYRKSPAAALDAFYRTAGLHSLRQSAFAAALAGTRERASSALAWVEPSGARPGAAERADPLRWGLEQLDQIALSPQLPANWSAWIGENDPLLDAARLQNLVPALRILPGATHFPSELIAAFAAAAQ